VEIHSLLSELKTERNRIDQAVSALEGLASPARRGRPRKAKHAVPATGKKHVLESMHYAELEKDAIYQDFLYQLFQRRKCLFLGFSFVDPAINNVLEFIKSICPNGLIRRFAFTKVAWRRFGNTFLSLTDAVLR
jgi:hypothetical protein